MFGLSVPIKFATFVADKPISDKENDNDMRKFVLALTMMAATTAMADNYSYLTVTTNDGEASYEISNISRITFDASNMILWNGDDKLGELPLTSLDKMSFTGDDTGIGKLMAVKKPRIQNGVLRVEAPEGTRITLYNIKGEMVREVTASSQETEINLSGYRKGVYIVKVGSTAQKFMNK